MKSFLIRKTEDILIRGFLYCLMGPVVVVSCITYELFSVYVLNKTVAESYVGKLEGKV